MPNDLGLVSLHERKLFVEVVSGERTQFSWGRWVCSVPEGMYRFQPCLAVEIEWNAVRVVYAPHHIINLVIAVQEVSETVRIQLGNVIALNTDQE